MICPKCGANMILARGMCAKCGYDIEVNRLTRRYSCYFYNRGLECARNRDLSGAAEMLQRALKVNKKNVDARNLLGLVYYETGDTVAAIQEWIISKSMLEDGNPAVRYLEVLHANPAKLDNLNLAIRKYNGAVDAVSHDGHDLALLQLKKAVSLNPHFIRAWQMLAVIYMRSGRMDKARECLRKTLAIDVANTTSLGYLRAIREMYRENRKLRINEAEKEEDEVDSVSAGGKSYASYLEEQDHIDYKVLLSLLAGVFLGIMVVYFLVIPGVKTGMKEDFKGTQSEYAEQMSQYLSDIDSLERETQSLRSKIELQETELEANRAELEDLRDKAGGINIFNMTAYYLNLRRKGSATKDELFILQKRINAVSPEELQNASAKAIYDRVLADYPDAATVTMTSSELYEKGRVLYDAQNYTAALEYFMYSYEKSADNEKNMFYLGRAYQLTGDKSAALRTFTEYMERFPEGENYKTVESIVAQLR
ncbi:MAG: tetratricopeptide repeat protein [Lachnospiraceae bacterium]|nr:tetratricopeptide repeat protein [Lachnospiraceae bacterium]MCR5087596.1 tetratricopeptide repeat protein [Lachnospiraceae bacterium]